MSSAHTRAVPSLPMLLLCLSYPLPFALALLLLLALITLSPTCVALATAMQGNPCGYGLSTLVGLLVRDSKCIVHASSLVFRQCAAPATDWTACINYHSLGGALLCRATGAHLPWAIATAHGRPDTTTINSHSVVNLGCYMADRRVPQLGHVAGRGW